MTRLPDFLLIGAAKSGTSALFRYLKQHPEIFLSPVKEPHFFAYTDQTKLTTGPGDTTPNAITDFDAYCALFQNAPANSKIGEASPSYLYREAAPKRIHAMLPNVKLIAMLRNPADRAFSAYMHLVRDGRETEKTFRNALLHEDARIDKGWGPLWHFTRLGFYAQQLARYYELFSPDQIKVFIYEDMIQNQAVVLKEIFQFVGVDPTFVPDTKFKVNVSGIPRNALLQKLINKTFDSPNPLRWIARLAIPELLRWRFTSTIRRRNLVKERLSVEDRQYLISIFREDVLALQDLLHRDLSAWLEK